MSKYFRFVLAALAASIAAGSTLGGQAATLTLNDPNCVDFGVSQTAGGITLTCNQASVPVPSCTLTPSSTSPLLGSTLTLTANCTQNPTSYTWSGCTSTTGTCTISGPASPASLTYGVVAANATGAGNPATAQVNWVSTLAAPSNCSIAANPPSLQAGGGPVTLTASCGAGGAATTFEWSGGGLSSQPSTSNQASTTISATTPFSVIASNSAGPAPAAGVTVTVATGTGGGGTISCAAEGFASTRTFPLNWSAAIGNVKLNTSGFGPGTAIVVPFTTPTASKNAVGNINVYETTGLSTFRTVTLSSEACGRGTVYQTARGYTAPVYFVVGGTVRGYKTLAPGTTYYVTIVNQYLGSETCASSACDATIELTKP